MIFNQPNRSAGWKAPSNPMDRMNSTRPTPTEQTCNGDTVNSARPDPEHPFTEAQVKEALGYDRDDPNVSVKIVGGSFPGDDSRGGFGALLDLILGGHDRVTSAVTETYDEDHVPGDLHEILDEVVAELHRAQTKHPIPFHSPHEGYAVIKEEFEELWDGIKADNYDTRKEAIQVAAMAVRYLLDIDPD